MTDNLQGDAPCERPNPIAPVGSPAPLWLWFVAAVYAAVAVTALAVVAGRLVART